MTGRETLKISNYWKYPRGTHGRQFVQIGLKLVYIRLISV